MAPVARGNFPGLREAGSPIDLGTWKAPFKQEGQNKAEREQKNPDLLERRKN